MLSVIISIQDLDLSRKCVNLDLCQGYIILQASAVSLFDHNLITAQVPKLLGNFFLTLAYEFTLIDTILFYSALTLILNYTALLPGYRNLRPTRVKKHSPPFFCHFRELQRIFFFAAERQLIPLAY